ncbi:MAG: capsular polysaccharide synthesis protein [Planctomycetaceae bacterium]|jgi:hypothetical protein|nr:capsular polysaccharide synthesis protein [Planctomycetaceae bacterium]
MIKTFAKLLTFWIPFRKLRRGLRDGLVRHNYTHAHFKREYNLLAKYLQKKYLAKRLPKYKFATKQDLGTDKIIWQFWNTGADNAPPLVKTCMRSVEEYKGDYRVIVLDDAKVRDYIDLPDFVYEKTKNGKFPVAHFADLLRLCLLKTYGGVWMDATIYLTGAVPQKLLEKDFFAFQRSVDSPSDWKVWEDFCRSYWSWDDDWKVRLLNSFIIAKPDYPLINALVDMMITYWEREKKPHTYLWFHILFNELAASEYKKYNCEIVCDRYAHYLYLNADAPAEKYDELLNLNPYPIHKLSRHLHITNADSVLAKILKPDIFYDGGRDDITFCTMLFNMSDKVLKAARGNDRDFRNFYLASLKHLILTFKKFAIWCDQETADFLTENDLADKVKMRVMKIEELPSWNKKTLYTQFINELRSGAHKNGMYFAGGRTAENLFPWLAINRAKLDVIKWAAENDFYDSAYFYWLDCGGWNGLYNYMWDG